MALLGQTLDFPIRTANKEPEWSSICNNVFDQYLDTDDLFGFEADQRERSSSDDSRNLFDFSTGSEQSHQTSGTSPIPSWECGVVQEVQIIEAKQPRAQEPVDFWTKTLRALEQNAAASEKKQQTLRTAKSHPDFLSLGGCPSPPAIPSSPTDQSFSAQRRRSRGAANGRKASQARSLSRGRPLGVTKPVAAVNPYATVRKASASPPKMMNPSRYRAGFKDVWTEKTERSPKKYQLRAPSQILPASPPPSARTQQEDDFAAFGSPTFIPLPAYDDQLSPLTNTFQQAHIHTPIASPPAINAAAHASDSYFSDVPPAPPNPYAPQAVPLNDTSPLFPERTSSLAPHKIQAFDFGFTSSPDIDQIDPFSTAPFAKPDTAHYTTDQPPFSDPFGGIDAHILPSTETHGLPVSGLGISCDPALVSNYSMPPTLTLASTVYRPGMAAGSPYYVPSHGHAAMPNTPHRRAESRLRSETPSPPATDSRARRASSRSRRTSRHRRTNSTNSTPRHSQNLEKGGFVNFTPHDSNKILSGVAPSGSSKTKARREKEATDKRRKLSQAAVKAVVDAGGDLDTLAKAGLLA